MTPDQRPPGQIGIKRLFNALKYSVNGLIHALKHETPFQQECILFLLTIPILFFLRLTAEFKLLLLTVNTLVLIVELINSAIEAIVDKVSPEYHDLARQAKDLGSAAVFLSILLAATAWILAFYSLL